MQAHKPLSDLGHLVPDQTIKHMHPQVQSGGYILVQTQSDALVEYSHVLLKI